MHERGDRRLLAAIEAAPVAYSESHINHFGSRVLHTDVLSDREHEALRAVSVGLSYADAGTLLGITRSGVREACRRAQMKLRAKNTTHAVATAIRAGLL